MSKQNSKRFNHVEKNRSSIGTTTKEKHKSSTSSSSSSSAATANHDSISKHMKKVYPIGGFYKTCSSLSLSSLSLSLSQNSNDSSLTTDSSTPLDQKIALALGLISSAQRKPAAAPQQQQKPTPPSPNTPNSPTDQEPTRRRCNWITKNSGKLFFYIYIYINKRLLVSSRSSFIYNASRDRNKMLQYIYFTRAQKFPVVKVFSI